MNIRKTITSEIEWNTIKKAQADGKLQELLQVGDELDITMKTGEELTVQAVGTTEHGLIFLLKDCMKDEHGMNKRMTNKGGWRDSEMRLWLNGTIIHMLPDELRVSAPVIKCKKTPRKKCRFVAERRKKR